MNPVGNPSRSEVRQVRRFGRAGALRAALVLGLGLVTAASGGQASGETLQPTRTVQASRGTGQIGPLPSPYDPRLFSSSEKVDNVWFPLEPGTQLVFVGATSEGKERIPHRLVFTVTDLVKKIGSVRNAVVWDRDYSAGELVEAELAFFAQDVRGNVWHTGEYPEEYEEGKLVGAPAWMAGAKGARAGIHMLAEPRLGNSSYAQGYAPPPVSWTDRAKVYKVSQRTCVPVDCYEDVLVTREYNPDEPGKSQLKYYARGVGNVRVGWTGVKDTDREVLQLVKVTRLGPAAMARARSEALRLERRAYLTKRAVYGWTPPLERTP